VRGEGHVNFETVASKRSIPFQSSEWVVIMSSIYRHSSYLYRYLKGLGIQNEAGNSQILKLSLTAPV